MGRDVTFDLASVPPFPTVGFQGPSRDPATNVIASGLCAHRSDHLPVVNRHEAPVEPMTEAPWAQLPPIEH